VQVAIERNGTQVTLSIRDNGAGFSLSNPRKPNSYGLLGLRERTSLLDGEASITSAPGEGTWVQIRLPIMAPATPS
jgi:signal transduction histidine kinase